MRDDFPRALCGFLVVAVLLMMAFFIIHDTTPNKAEAAPEEPAIPDAFKLVQKQHIDGVRVIIIEDNVTHKQYILYSSSCIIPR